MFDIILYNNRAEPNRLDKTTYIDRYTTLKGTLKNSTSIINPTIIIEFNDRQDYVVDGDNILVMSDGVRVVDVIALADFLQANYAHIPIFKRYYYITDIVSVRNNLWEIQMSVDVLMSYKDDILKQECIVARNEFDYDLQIDDRNVTTIYGSQLYIEEYETNCFTNFQSEELSDNLNYIVTAITLTELPYNALDVKSFNGDDVIHQPNTRFSMLNGYNAKFVCYRDIEYILKSAIVNEFVASSIINVRAYPINFPQFISEKQSEIVNSYFQMIDGSYIDVSDGVHREFTRLTRFYNNVYDVATIIIPVAFGNSVSFLDYEPYRFIYLYLPYYGYYKVSNSRYVNKEIKIRLIVDLDSGNGTYVINDNIDNILLDTITFKLGVDIGISYGNIESNNIKENQLTLKGVKSGFSLLGSLGLAIGSAVGGNYATAASLAVGGLTQFAGTMIDIASNQMSLVDFIQSSENNGENSSFYLTNKVILLEERRKLCPNYGTDLYKHTYGMPYNKNSKLSNLNGFTQIYKVHLENIGTASLGELSEIEQLLLSGVILP